MKNFNVGSRVCLQYSSRVGVYSTGTVLAISGSKCLVNFEKRNYSRWCLASNLNQLIKS